MVGWAVATTLTLVVLALLVLVTWSPLAEWDQALVERAYAYSAARPGLVDVLALIADAFEPLHVRLALLAVALVFLLRGARALGLWILAVTLAEMSVVFAIKQAIRRARPLWDEPLDVADGFSFPSGHSSTGALVAGVVVVLATVLVRRTWLRVALIVTGLLFALLMGLDRIFLGVHKPSDVLASYLLVAMVVLVLLAAVGGIAPTSRSASRHAPAPSTGRPSRKPRLAVVLNPIRIGDPRAFRRQVIAAADRAGWDIPLWFETTVDDAGRAMTHAALTADADIVVAAGGDGTVRVVASELARTGVPLGILAAGTGNLLARNLSLPLQTEPALEVILHGRDRAIDLVRMEGDGLVTDHFAVMGGLGLDAAIMQGAPVQMKKRIGWPAYVVAALRHVRYPAVRVEITVDGGETVRRRVQTVVIGNVGTLQAGIPLLPDARPDDGLLDVVVVAPRRMVGWLGLLWRVLTRRRRTDERLDRMTGRSVLVEAAHATPRQMDGDTCGAGHRISAEVEPGVLLVRVPR